MDRNSKFISIIKILLVLFGIQATRILIKQIAFQFVEKSALNSDLVTASIMLLFAVLILLTSEKLNINLSIFPDTQKKGYRTGYSIATIIVLFLIILNPVFSGDFSANTIIPLILSTLATPIFEELIFRGYVWNELKQNYRSEFTVYILNTIVFALWHLGYADTIWFRMSLMGNNSGLAFVMLMKVITGLCFGIVIGFVRYKMKSSYAAMLMHSLMNIFGR